MTSLEKGSSDRLHNESQHTHSHADEGSDSQIDSKKPDANCTTDDSSGEGSEDLLEHGLPPFQSADTRIF